MGNFVKIGSRAGEVVLYNKREKLVVLTPKQAMALSCMGEVLARAAIGANNSRESGPTVLEMVDILEAVGMHYRSDDGKKGTWPRLSNLEKVENEKWETTYHKITTDAYNTLSNSLLNGHTNEGEDMPAILHVGENGEITKDDDAETIPSEYEEELDNEDDSALDLHFGDPV